jgi:hypothetical protein
MLTLFFKSIIASSKSILIPLFCSYELEAIVPPPELPSNFNCAPDAEPIVALPSSVKLKHYTPLLKPNKPVEVFKLISSNDY